MNLLFSRLEKHSGRFAIVVFLRAMSSLAALFLPYLMSDIVNIGITNKDMDYIVLRGIQMLVVSLVAMGSSIFTIILNQKITTDFTGSLQKELFAKIISMKFEDYSHFGTSSLITRCNEDVYTLENVIGQITFVFISFPVLFFGGVILTMSKDVRVGLIMLFVSPLILVFVIIISKSMRTLWENSDKYIDEQNKLVRERLSGLRVIRAFDKEDFEHEKIAAATKKMAVNIIKANVRGSTMAPVCTLMLNLVLVLMLYVGASDLSSGGTVTAGDIIASVQYIALVLNGILILSWAIVFLPHLWVSLRRIREILDTPTAEGVRSTGVVTDGSFTMENVCFSYPGAEIESLSDINLVAHAGETVAIIGGTGCGKSTLTKILMGFYPIKSGRILLGDCDCSTLSTETIRDNISVALQKSMIFEGSIADNIRFGKSDATEDEMIRVTKIAQIYDFVCDHEEGFDYLLTQAGANISGGQKQRIGIARTIIKNAPIYIFDDSFSALDFLTESKLRIALNEYLKGRTQIIITQRAATAMSCDRIYVLDEGRIAGSGTHEELLQSCSIYKEIYDSQLGNSGRQVTRALSSDKESSQRR